MYKTGSPSTEHVMSFKDALYGMIGEAIHSQRHAALLDIGCKDGIDLLHIYSRWKVKGYGLDISMESLRRAAQKIKEGESIIFIQALAEKMPFAKNAFDIVVASEIIEHLDHPDQFLQGIRGIMKAGGLLLITTPPRYAYTTVIGKLLPETLKKNLRKLIYYKHSPMSGIKEILPDGTVVKEHVHEFVPEELETLLSQKGFKTLKIHQGALRVPFIQLFDRVPVLLALWKIFDRFLSKFPCAIYLKANFIVAAQKEAAP